MNNKNINEKLKKYSIKELKTSALNVSNRYRSNDGSGKVLLSNERDAISYALSRMPATTSANEFVINDLINLTNCSPKTVLDVGAGTGASSIAIQNLISDVKLTLLEREKSMLNIAKKLVDSAEFINQDILTYDSDNHFDLVVASYVMNELNKNNRKIVLNKLLNLTNKYLIIIDAGTPKNYLDMMEIRDYLISLGAKILAPCPHCEKCPLLSANDWCHFTTRVERTSIHRELKGGILNYEDEKFTYLIFEKGDNLNTVNNYRRIIRHPKFRPKVVELKLCTKDGIEEIIISKSNSDYKKARDIKCGDRL